MKTKEEVAAMSRDELGDFLREQICIAEGCFNYPASGVIYCERCLHGAPTRASDELIFAKQRLERMKAR